MGFGQNSEIYKAAYESLVTWFNPHMGYAYMHYPLFGSAMVEDYNIKDGKLVSYNHKNRTESNGIDFYITTMGQHHISYSAGSIVVKCDVHKMGDRSGLKNKSSHSHAYSIDNISVVNDSTFIVSENKWVLTVDKHRWSNRTEIENDLWNVSVVFEGLFPVKIIRGYEVMTFRYLKFDKFGNWTEREIVYENGLKRIQSRSIKYDCELCGGKGHVPRLCANCYGTGRCRANHHVGPDGAVGICPYCGGRGIGRGVTKCTQCN